MYPGRKQQTCKTHIKCWSSWFDHLMAKSYGSTFGVVLYVFLASSPWQQTYLREARLMSFLVVCFKPINCYCFTRNRSLLVGGCREKGRKILLLVLKKKIHNHHLEICLSVK